jgi:muramoyltetrapeptide carboxypeptidase LdcA involved in peptidoglycan recycling
MALTRLPQVEFRKPDRIRPGDTVAAISMSWGGAGLFPQVVDVAKQNLADLLGVTVIDTPHALAPGDWLYANPKARAEDLHWALENPEVSGIFSYIGGSESVRTLEHIDPALIADHPKVLVGFSDTTCAQSVFLNAGVSCLYGPSLMAGVADFGWASYAAASLEQMLSGWTGLFEPAPGWTEDNSDWEADDFRSAVHATKQMFPGGWTWSGQGRGEGQLVGGCVEVLEMLKGTPYFPAREVWSGAVLMLETSEDVPSPDQVEYWLRNYATQGILDLVEGLVLARPRGYSVEMRQRLADAVSKVLAEVGRSELPVVMDVDCGHTSPMMTLPLGCRVAVDAGARTFELLEPAVT